MREIKFRAWDKKSKKMRVVYCIVYDTYSKFCKNHKIKIVKLWGKVFPAYDDGECNTDIQIQREPKQVELMQYIGAKDKNGVEIYEGDIIKEPYYVDENNGFLLLEVVFDKGAFMGKVINRQGFGIQNFTMYKEVIGNIYENKELLGDN